MLPTITIFSRSLSLTALHLIAVLLLIAVILVSSLFACSIISRSLASQNTDDRQYRLHVFLLLTSNRIFLMRAEARDRYKYGKCQVTL